jgi:hypothetical protein
MINVKEESDGSLTIDWNETDPRESMLNNWKEEDFLNAICEALNDRKTNPTND